MNTFHDFKHGYLKNLDASAIELKYANSKLAFLVVLPNQRTGLSALEIKMKDYDFAEITKEMSVHTVSLAMPNSKLNTTSN